MPRIASNLIAFAFCAIAATLAGAQSQAWEKLVAPGLTYRMEIDLQKPLVVHALRWTSASGAVRARVETARDTIVAPGDVDKLKGRDVLTNAMKRTQAIAGVNGDFFPWMGNPLGCMLRDGELIALPYPDRSVFAWGPSSATVAEAKSAGGVTFSGATATLTGLNRMAGDNDLVLQTSVAGFSLAKGNATHVIFSGEQMLRPGVQSSGMVSRVETGKPSVQLAPGEWALTASGTNADTAAKLKTGDRVTVQYEIGGLDLTKFRNIIGGGPSLMRGGKVYIDAITEKFSNAFVGDRHPRTAVGYTKDGDVWLVVVDGRQLMSRGVTLVEMADIMAGLGCIEALNLDGGGSSTIAINGLVMNRPSDGQERPIANALLLFGNAPTMSSDDMVIKGVPTLVMGQPTTFTVVDQKGDAVPNGEVLWSSRGPGAWIDQSGTIRPLKAGEITVYAAVRGKLLSVRVVVADAI